MINTEVKKNWCNALRSGKYLQTEQCLQDSSGAFCCLGVLCEITPNINKEDRHYNYGDIGPYDAELRWFDVDLPPKLREEIGLTVEEESTLIRLNDEDGQDFKAIADWIERNL